jgi:hypothetical protein
VSERLCLICDRPRHECVKWDKLLTYDPPRAWRERALQAEARVRDLEETVGEALGQSDYWYELWRRAANALLACECRR